MKQPVIGASGKLAEFLADLDDIRTYGCKAKRAVALIYTHFKSELEV